MQRALPEIRESADELQRLLRQERRHVRQQRLHALYLLASKQARQRSEVAVLLGVNRNTVGRWLDQYQRGGIDALLAVYIPAGKRKPLSSEQLAELARALEEPHGFALYGEIRSWIATTFGVEMTYNAVHKLVRYTLRAKAKVPRPSHIKKPDAEHVFWTTFADQLRAAVPVGNHRPVAVWAYDESRFGLQTIRRRRITACGTKPVGHFQHRFENFYLYGMVGPQSGDAFFLGLPKLNTNHVQVFLDEFAQARPDTLNVVLLDNARCHTTRDLVVPENIILLFQPPYTPEVNPYERVWQDLKGDLAWGCFADLPSLQARIVDLVQAYDTHTLRSLTAYPWILDAIAALSV